FLHGPGCGLAYLYQFDPASAEGFPEQVSGFAVTSASSKNSVTLFIPSANQCFAILPNKRERRCLHSIGESILHHKGVKIGLVLGGVELRGTSSSGMECDGKFSPPTAAKLHAPVKTRQHKWFTPATKQRITSASS